MNVAKGEENTLKVGTQNFIHIVPLESTKIKSITPLTYLSEYIPECILHWGPANLKGMDGLQGRGKETLGIKNEDYQPTLFPL